MPEYLSPGAYIAETSPRARAVEGTPTSTFGMTGATEYGPTPIPGLARVHPALLAGGPAAASQPGPVLVTSFADYERVFGGLTIAGRPCHLAHAARLFFDNGGRRLYVARVFAPTMASTSPQILDVGASFASLPAPSLNPVLRWMARWPGSMGARIQVSVALRRGNNALVGGVLRGLQAGAAVEVAPAGSAPTIPDETDPVPANVRIVAPGSAGVLGYLASDGTHEAADPATAAFPLTFTVTVRCGDRVDVYDGLELDPRRGVRHPRSVFDVLRASEPPDQHGLVWCDLVDSGDGAEPSPGEVASALLTLRTGAPLRGGGDGEPLTADLLRGNHADADSHDDPARGLGALAEIDEIAIVAAPDAASLAGADRSQAVDDLIAHCEQNRFRFAVVDPPPDCSVHEVRDFRSRFDTAFAALYYPWLRIVDPTGDPATAAPRPLLEVPPSGAVAGIYARTDLARGVHEAPANEVIQGIAGLAVEVTQSQQDLLHPEGVNVLRSFEGRGRRVWGGRTMSTEPEWRYVNVRRLLTYLEHSIVTSTQWAVFEPNDERLWSSVSGAIESFLFQEWAAGALQGAKPEQAFLVRCDRTTMTQGDLGDGRLVCLVGVAAVRPAEFMIFRIDQRTADAPQS